MTACMLVTGGGRGIGAAIVRAVAARGHPVCFTYLQNDAAAAALEGDIRMAGGRARGVRGDVADPAFPEHAFDEAERFGGPVGALVNNAGITGGLGPFSGVTPDTIRRTLNVNLVGAMLMARQAVRRWQADRIAGRIVNISSIAATLGAPGEYVHYAAAKAGLESFTIGLGREVAPLGIRVNAVAPGTTNTDIHAAMGAPDRPARAAARIPLGRPGEPEEIAAAVLWLLSDEASYVTATVLRVAGGL